MTAKEYLSQIRTLDIIINQKLAELDNLHDIATAIGSFDYSQERVQTSPDGEAPYARTAEKAAELDAEITMLIDKRLDIINQIQGLEDVRYIRILYHRYVEGKPLDVIAAEMNYDPTYTRDLHGQALKSFATSYTILHLDVLS